MSTVSLNTTLSQVEEFTRSNLTENNNVTTAPFLEENVSELMWKTLPIPLLCVGLAGNILTIKVLLRMGIRRQPTLMFLLFLSVTDTVVLLTVLPRYWIYYTFKFDLKLVSNAICKLYFFIVYLSFQYSSWILVGISIERAVKTNFPLRYKNVYTRKRVLIGLFLTLLCLCCVNVHFFFTNGINYYNEGKCESLSPEYLHFDEFVFVYIDLCVSSIIPFLIMFVCNILLIRILRIKQRERPNLMHGIFVKRANRSSVKMTKMLVVGTAYFIIATAPLCIYYIVDSYLLPGYEKSKNASAIARMNLIRTVCFLIALSNNCVNFYLYTAINDRFYKEFKAMLRCQPRYEWCIHSPLGKRL
ncbi:hypothetical protein DPMN_159592 [Dreissena polymorpha]|uniref:G-protein coupled receptors family 1 profile domain-containing protein n=1 Tax=Dreissena polymorpha TaxID=45954 RepID=A0A9D4EKX3_DREPO|nr:hypothetical protein DPMN_159592 [Dreissena polymorpha]